MLVLIALILILCDTWGISLYSTLLLYDYFNSARIFTEIVVLVPHISAEAHRAQTDLNHENEIESPNCWSLTGVFQWSVAFSPVGGTTSPTLVTVIRDLWGLKNSRDIFLGVYASVWHDVRLEHHLCNDARWLMGLFIFPFVPVMTRKFPVCFLSAAQGLVDPDFKNETNAFCAGGGGDACFVAFLSYG